MCLTPQGFDTHLGPTNQSVYRFTHPDLFLSLQSNLRGVPGTHTVQAPFAPGYHLVCVHWGSSNTDPWWDLATSIEKRCNLKDLGKRHRRTSCWQLLLVNRAPCGPPTLSCYRSLDTEVTEFPEVWFVLNSKPGLVKAVFSLQPRLTGHVWAL